MENDALTAIMSPGISEAELVKAMRQVQSASVPLAFWTKIANDPRYAKPHRLHCIRRLFEGYTSPGMTLLELGKVLHRPDWLQEEDVSVVEEVGGELPVRWTDAGAIVRIRPFGWVLPAIDPGIYLRISEKLSVREFLAVIRGESAAKRVEEAKLLEVGLLKTPDDRLT